MLTVAGSDSGGGAGIQADLKTMLAHGVHGMSVLTAVTAQNSLGVQGVWPLPAEAIEAQFRSVVDDIGVDAVKTGMLGTRRGDRAGRGPAGRTAVRDAGGGRSGLREQARRSADRRPDAVAALRGELLPGATVLTPNLPEAALLAGLPARAPPAELAAALLAESVRRRPPGC